MKENQCQNCQHYLQHYTFDERTIFRIHCGHCTFPRIKTRSPDTAACKNFVPGTPQEDAFVCKEYLSKALLAYMMQLELLPEIQESR